MNEGITGSSEKYRYIRNLADGGMGTVGLAVREEGRFRRVYALKRLLPEVRREPRVRAMFLEEARIAGLIHHPNVVSVVDVGEDADGPYLVMEYVPGVSLSELVKATRARGEVLPVQICARIIKDVAQGLHAAHELKGHDGQALGLVHRDVSPQNVLVGYDGLVRLTDFGIAKALGRQDRTSTGVLKGKFGYFAPEQLQFEEPTRRSDLFSLGVVFYEALAGERLYAAESQSEVARRILKEPPPDIDEVRSDVHPMVVQLLFSLLAKDPGDRPASARNVATTLDRALIDMVVQEGTLSVADFVAPRFEDKRQEQVAEVEHLKTAVELGPISDPPALRRRRRRARLLGLVAAAMLVLGAWLLFARVEPPPVTELPASGVAAASSAESPKPMASPVETEPIVAAKVPEPAESGQDAAQSGSPERSTPAKRARTRKPTRRASKTVSAEAPPVARPTPGPRATPTPGSDSPATEGLMTWGERKR